MAYAADAAHARPRPRRPALLAALVLLDEPQGHRHALPDLRLLRRVSSAPSCPSRMRLELAGARAADLREPAELQRLRHRPRPHHGLLHGDAGAHRRLRQLVRAPHDRRARHGVPAHEQHLLLAHGRGLLPPRHLAVLRRRAGLARLRRRLDGLPAARRPSAIPARRSISASSRCTSPAPPRSSARSTSSPRSSTCARRA